MSFEPPPWLEFTTYDPARSATRVSPPGNTQVRDAGLRAAVFPAVAPRALSLLPWLSTNGRRSTRRGSTPRRSAIQVGHVDSSMRGCAT